MMPKVGRMWLWDRESRGWTDTPQAPAVGSELFRPQTSPSCGVIWRVKLISEGLLGRPREMRHKTKPTPSSTPREVATYCIPASRARVWDAWRGPQLSQRPPPAPRSLRAAHAQSHPGKAAVHDEPPGAVRLLQARMTARTSASRL